MGLNKLHLKIFIFRLHKKNIIYQHVKLVYKLVLNLFKTV